MKPFRAILRKESRQQGGLALAMVLFCLVIQLSAFVMSLFPELGNAKPEYFAIAIFVTALFSGAAAAISFSGEQDEHTFTFLRMLPVSTKSIFLGKTAWLVLGTLMVLLGNSLLAGVWSVTARGYGDFTPPQVMATFGVGILEAFVWGLFWSPRCRSQVHALLATYFCASSVGYFCAIYVRGGSTFAEIYANAIPLRLAVLAVVGVFAVWGGLRWFDFWVQGRNRISLLAGFKKILFGHLPFPKRIQSPFSALVHQGFRQSQLFLSVGFLAGIVTLWLFAGKTMDAAYSDYYFSNRLFAAFTIVYFVVLCGCIFGGDQKNGTYRFFGRCGVRPGTVWWSRVLPMLLITLPILLVLIVWQVDMEFFTSRYGRVNGWTRWQAFSEVFSTTESRLHVISKAAAIWLVPIACGAMISISVKRTIVAVALTGAAAGALFFWMGMGQLLFGFSPLWTTLPLCLALLVASRLQAENWIRERTGWRCYIKSLAPFFATGAVLLAAVPPIRVYSVPYVSLAEVEALLDRTDLPERLSPAERTKLFHDTAAKLSGPLPENFQFPFLHENYYKFTAFYSKEENEKRIRIDESSLERSLKMQIRQNETEMGMEPKFEQWLLGNYEWKYRLVNSGQKIRDLNDDVNRFVSVRRYLPWERDRVLRRFACQMIFCIENTGRIQGDYSLEGTLAGERDAYLWSRTTTPLFDDLPWHLNIHANLYFYNISRFRLHLVHFALHLWYLEHDETLPETLDELVAENYLQRIPTDPRTGEPMRYIREFDEKSIEENRRQILSGTKPGWPNLEFGRIGVNETRVDLKFLPGYDEYGKIPGQ